ncbi:helix-turn-helix domain-containing protein [Cohnella silvisoli]|uniref:S24 family peptidase n=1 Tax=Cohnella silvisoli TaxID=2873699 RepID=A0ABV1L2D5_9BACL|nr:S24 family peptidase [Cohnella silvisoli]MCD9025781.1 helix-turn-helix domain-containing protein [Cohnella silvisoli]
MNTIGERIKFLRDSKNLSMGKLENAIGASGGSADKWEKNKSVPGGNYIIALSNFFDVTTDWILKGEETHAEKKQGESANFFEEKWESVSHFETLIKSLDSKDQEFIDRYIQLALFQKNQLNNSSDNIVTTQNFYTSPSEVTPLIQESPASYSTPSAIPVLGRAAAGVPIELVRFIEGYIRVGDKYRNCFAVKVDGDSMINVGIEDGGYVVVRQQESVDDNEIALVMVDDGVTIKRFRKVGGLAHLVSENDGMNTMIYDPRERNMRILGVIVDIISPLQASNLLLDEL